jgi:lysophospholipase L1-like esterase
MIDLNSGERYGLHERYPGVLRQELGADYWVIEEGLGGRTTVWDDPYEPYRSGKAYLMPCLLTHNPIDLVALMLGTNDLKHRFGLSAYDIASGADVLVDMILRSECGPKGSAPQVLLICPPPLARLTLFAEMFEGGDAKSRQLAPHYQRVAKEHGCAFLDAGKVITSSDRDGVHFEVSEHAKLGKAVAAAVREVFKS